MASIRKRTWSLANGETRTAWLTSYLDQAGTRRHRQFKTRKSAAAFLTTATYEVSAGTHSPASGNLTVREAVKLWIDHAETECDPVTLRSYRAAAAHHVLPFLGHMKVAKLNRPMVERFRDDLLKGALPDGQARSRVMTRKAIGALCSALGEAHRLGLVGQNVASGIKIRSTSDDRKRLEVGRDVPSKAEVAQLLAAVSPKWRPMFIVGVFCGLRASELRGLAWANVDFQAKVLRIRQRADVWGGLGKTKSAAGERDVPMAPMVANTLREWKLACPPSELVFPRANGRPLNHSTVYREGFGAVQVECGIVTDEGKPRYSPHDFRHFTASWLIDQGFGPKWIMTVMGHANISMTYDRYGHWMAGEDDHDRLAAAEQALLAVKG